MRGKEGSSVLIGITSFTVDAIHKGTSGAWKTRDIMSTVCSEQSLPKIRMHQNSSKDPRRKTFGAHSTCISIVQSGMASVRSRTDDTHSSTLGYTKETSEYTRALCYFFAFLILCLI